MLPCAPVLTPVAARLCRALLHPCNRKNSATHCDSSAVVVTGAREGSGDGSRISGLAAQLRRRAPGVAAQLMLRGWKLRPAPAGTHRQVGVDCYVSDEFCACPSNKIWGLLHIEPPERSSWTTGLILSQAAAGGVMMTVVHELVRVCTAGCTPGSPRQRPIELRHNCV